MPIYEFKCLKCNEFFEILVTNKDEDMEMGCPKCKSEEFERVLSATSYAMGGSGSSSLKTENRKCSSGSCTTYEIPGHTH
jgi:putative FmdB family regulatory protein